MPATARIALALLVLACLASPVDAQDAEQGAMILDAVVDVQANGDARWSVIARFHPDDFPQIVATWGDPFLFFRRVAASRPEFEFADDVACRFDEDENRFLLQGTQLGAAENLGQGVWQIDLREDAQLVREDMEKGRRFFGFGVNPVLFTDFSSAAALFCVLPAGAEEASWDEKKRSIRYRLPAAEGDDSGRITIDCRAKTRLMASVYKVYGQREALPRLWVAKPILRNVGNGVVRDVAFRCCVEGFSEWTSWETIPEMVPGQTCVRLYYPVLTREIAALRSGTKTNVQIECRWKTARGEEKTASEQCPVSILGMGEFVFSDLPREESLGTYEERNSNASLLATFVTRNDPLVQRFAAAANKNAGGVGATQSRQSALRVLKAIWDLMRHNDFTYQHPQTLEDRSLSFDAQLVQNIKFPRDVITSRSGTCIDLAILYASLAHAVGLRPRLVLLPDHCYPVIDLPEGDPVAVETTQVKGGIRYGSGNFSRAVAMGADALTRDLKGSRVIVIDVQTQWSLGIENPELPELPVDAFEKLGLKESLPAAGKDAADAVSDFIGTWGTSMTEDLRTGQTVKYEMIMVISRREGSSVHRATLHWVHDVPDRSGRMVPVKVDQTMEGKATDGTLVLTGQKKTMTFLTTGKVFTMNKDIATLRITPDGLLEGKLGNDKEGYGEGVWGRR